MSKKPNFFVQSLVACTLFFASSAYAGNKFTCDEAKGYTDALKKGSAVIKGVNVTGETILVGTAQAGSNHEAAVTEGARFGILPAFAYPNNTGTLEAPNVTINNYMLVKYTYATPVTFSGDVTINDVDKSGDKQKYADAVTLWYEDATGTIHPATASSFGVGGSLIDFSLTLGTQPPNINLPAPEKGYSTATSSLWSNNDPRERVSYSITTPVKAIYVAYWNNWPSGQKPSKKNPQGVRFCAPLPDNAGSGNNGGGNNGGGGNTNNNPIAVDDNYTTKVNVPIPINPLGNDTDPDGDSLHITKIGQYNVNGGAQTINLTFGGNNYGKLVIDANNHIQYFPKENWAGYTWFTYNISDGKGGTAQAKIYIYVKDTPPVAVDDNYSTPLNTPIVIHPLDKDSDSDINDTISIKSIAGQNFTNNATINISDGKLKITNGIITFIPKKDFAGTTHFNYTIKDRYNKTAQAQEIIKVGPKVSTPKVSLIEYVNKVIDSDGNGIIEAGDKVEFLYVVKNIGNTQLKDINVTDKKVGSINCPKDFLKINQIMRCYKTYTLTQEDVNKGIIEASSIVTGKDLNNQLTKDISDTGTNLNGKAISNPEAIETPNPAKEYPNNPIDPTDDPTSYYVKPLPKVELLEAVCEVIDVNGNNITDAGDKVRFKYIVKNIGKTTLTQISIHDNIAGDVDTSNVQSIKPGKEASFCKAYTITQNDVNKGIITTSSKVEAVDENGKKTSDISDAATAPNKKPIVNPEGKETSLPNVAGNDPKDPTDDPLSLYIKPIPKLSLIESVYQIVDEDNNKKIEAGDSIRFEYNITNIGNVDIVSDIIVKDKTVQNFDCSNITEIKVGESKVCYGTYQIIQDDMDKGAIEASSSVSGKDNNGNKANDTSDAGTKPNGDVIPNPEAIETPNPLHKYPNNRFDPKDDPTTYILKDVNANISIIKSIKKAIDENNDGDIWEGDTLVYEYLVTNSGNVYLTNVQVSEPEVSNITCPKSELAVGESMVCQGRHTITKADTQKVAVDGQATATGVDPKGNTVRAKSDAGTNLKKEPINDPYHTMTLDPVTGTATKLYDYTTRVLLKAFDDNKPVLITDYKEFPIDVAKNDKFRGKIKIEIIKAPKYGTAKVVYDKNGYPKIYYKPYDDANNVFDSITYRISDEYNNADEATASFELRCSSTQKSDSGDALNILAILAMIVTMLFIARNNTKGELND